jgi:FG-GAP-like repeat
MTKLSLNVPRRYIRPLVGSLMLVLAFVFLFVLSYITTTTSAQVKEVQAAPESPAAVFPANAGTLGAIPDGTALSPLPAYGAARDVTFTVSGLSGAPSNVEVSFTSGGPSHTFRGDLEVVLKAPGGTPSFTLFSRTGATSSAAFGSASDLTGPYNFKDSATGGASWWTNALTPTTPGDYRSIVPGSSAVTPAVTTITPAFSSVSNPNGTWTLSFRDGCSADTGAISAASLTITAAPAGQHIVDMNGDGKTDWNVVRNTGGGPTGQITWFTQYNGVAGGQTDAWGIATDFFVPGDYDGDGKTDVSVWRPGPAGSAAWYTLQSATSTLRADIFGQTGDDPTVQGDYNGDGKEDIAVYRAGANAGNPSFWHWRTVVNGPVFATQWGQNGDFAAPGDYDNDGKNDFVIQRNAGGGQARFWTLLATGASSSVVFGTPTDVIVPGDYDGDGRTDIATVRGISGQIYWFVLPSSGGAYTNTPWGSSGSDFVVQGDYDGDGKTDLAVWRPSADPTQNFFYVLGTTSGFTAFEWGQNGDYPVANYNTH